MKTDSQMRRNYLHIFILIVIGILFIGVITATAEAKINPNSTMIVNINATTDTSLTWKYSYTVLLTKGSLDGVDIIGFDTRSFNFTANELKPNSSHEFCIYSVTEVNCEIGKTLESNTLIDTTLAIIFGYIFFIAAILCIIIGRWIPLVAWIGVGLSCIGIVSMVGISFWAGFVFMVVFCAGVIVALSPE
jgi:hypothetical protein